MNTKVKKKRNGPPRGGAPKGHPPYPGSETGGRPRKWDGESLDELADRLDEWIANAVENKTEFFWWDWCYQVGLNHHKVAKFAERSEKFRRSYENAKAWQESIVVRFALTKKFSEGFSKFFLINRNPEQWKEKVQEAPTIESDPAFEKIMDYLEKNQSSALNKAESNNIKEEKS